MAWEEWRGRNGVPCGDVLRAAPVACGGARLARERDDEERLGLVARERDATGAG